MYFIVMAVSPFKNGPSDRFAGFHLRRHGLRVSPSPIPENPLAPTIASKAQALDPSKV
jgi:hypothetical protein